MKHSAPPHAAVAPPSPEELLDIMADQSRPLRLDAFMRVLGLARRRRRELEQTLNALAAEGRVLRLRGGLWVRPEHLKHIAGRFTALRDGGGFVTPVRNGVAPHPQFAGGRDVYIPAAHTNGAWHQDMVRVALAPGAARGRSPEGRIIEVVERGLKEVPALAAQRAGRMLFCRPADARLPVDFRVELAEGAPPPAPGALVLLAPLEQLASNLWSARLMSDYGREDDVAVQEELVKCNHEAPRDFPAAALAEAQALPDGPMPEDLRGREDLRALPLVTIDGADARDFDDAVHVEGRPGGGWLLRVAIADVSHYVRPRGGGHAGALDAEALARGNSWYFPRSVEPMLPEALCNGLCSLKPGEDRLAVLAEIPFAAGGRPGRPRFALAVMRSAARLTYDQVKACLLDKDPAALAELRGNPRGEEVLTMLERAFALYAALREARRQRGSLDFDVPEAECLLDDAGRVARLGNRRRHDAHRLIEEFMIAANEAVARHLRDAGLPFLYRVHPAPDPDRLESLRDTLEAAGLPPLPPRSKNGTDAGLVGAALAVARGTPKEFLVNRLCLRAMPQARYQPCNEGHFGLASQAYCHFTSPIRRYADLLVHRTLKASLGKDAGVLPAGQKLLRVGDALNRRERAAMECEREMDRRLGCLALLPRVGEHFRGVVSGVTGFGVFVELADMPVEGMIRIEDLGEDWYAFDARSLSLVGRRSGVTWRMGLELDVMLAEVNLGRLEIRLLPLELPRGLRRGKGGRHSPRARRATAPRSDRQTGPAREDRSRPGKTAGERDGMRKRAHGGSRRGSRRRGNR
ncbi:MAG: ribonuclease R [Desulfovibrio desulfuricans]|jgi:ribonuclease R|nr:ribonuclease R [Desulfovibrio desulfuricans]